MPASQQNSPLSLLEILQKSSAFLEKKRVPEARLQAEYLLAHLLGIRRLELYLQFDRPLFDGELAPLRELLRKRGERIPLQHLLGKTEFYGRSFQTDQRALIPRPETELLIELALKKLAVTGEKKLPTIIDVGTGSGILIITLALELLQLGGDREALSSLHAIDLSQEALALAQENAALHELGMISWHHGNLLEPVVANFSSIQAELIVANLPYIPAAEIAFLQAEVQYDPLLALEGGKDGTELIAELVATAPSCLARGGTLLLEIGAGQEAVVASCLEQHQYQEIQQYHDYQGIVRFLEAQRPN